VRVKQGELMELTIKMEPVAKGRPRMAVCKGGVHSYTPEKTEQAQELLQAVLSEHIKDKFEAYIPVRLTAVFYRTKSKWSPKCDTLPVRKPDLDNYLKLVMDSANDLLIADDAQITAISVKKRWSMRAYGYIKFKLEEDKL